mmetsp:Transcript_6717/g.18265  ORF Transcript_6717/g.18265 Transcript_6717/m.18265 type:complete len:138 (-) Transcript_6717:172-585(-)
MAKLEEMFPKLKESIKVQEEKRQTRKRVSWSRSGTPKKRPGQNTPKRSAKKRKAPQSARFVNCRVAKEFSDGTSAPKIFEGVVDGIAKLRGRSETLWHVTYEDGDDEDLNETEVKECIAMYRKCHRTGRKRVRRLTT